MNREEFLELLKAENEDNEPYEAETSRLGWKIGAISALAIAICVFLLELVIWGKYNLGVFMVLVTMVGVSTVVQAFKIKQPTNVILAVVYAALLLVLVIMYAFAICYGWV